MLKYLKIGISALALSAFVVAPAVTVVTADVAFAKSDNGGGKGGGNGGGKGNGGGNKGGKGADKGGKSADKANKGANKSKKDGSRNKSAGKTNFQKDMKDLGRSIKGLFGKKEKTVVRASKPVAAKTAKVAKVKGPLHPSNLGKLNGAINSSPNAKAAHIANGNYLTGTGPVSLAAALAVADYDFAQATEAFDTASKTAALADAFDVLADESLPSLEDASALLTAETETPGSQDPLALEGAQKVVDASAATEGQTAPTPEEAEMARATLEEGAPSEGDVTDAEAAVLAAYKGSLTDEMQEDKVLMAVRDANPTDDAIAAAIAKGEMSEDDTEEVGMDDDDLDEDDLDEDPTDSAMIEDAELSDQG